jgi:ribonuclease P protein component
MQFLKKKSDYERLRNATQRRVSRYFIVVYTHDTSITEPHFGVTVSKKVGRAVTRNRVKRRIRAFLRSGSVPTREGIALYNIIALPSVVDVRWSDFVSDLSYCLSGVA